MTELTKQNHSLTRSQSNELLNIPEESVWLANYTSKATQKTYSVAVREFFRYHDMQDINDLRTSSPAHVIAWRDQLINSGATSRTVNNRLSALSSLFKHLCEKQIISKNPVHGIKRPKVNQSQVKTPAITKQQVRKVLELPDQSTPKGLRDAAILYTYFYSGCRRSEVRNLKASHILQDNGYYVIDFTVKGGKENRLAVHPELQNVLNTYLSSADHLSEPDVPLFISVQKNEERKPLNPKSLNRIFKHYIIKAGLPGNITPHSARATFITEALKNNCSIEAVQASVAHANISTTQMYDKRKKNYKDSASLAVRF
ncbi:tyrosine-type recombinase/integrase [Marinicella litoralis]|uniref:Site-specific recombinase XerD n=1 Tax=Marinicella litoralis TaxID=644220 RepID=A0A4R6XPY7_9GAMM|nr:tyrosine-type recombinase/integrase [Marinicella litoralis]TDR18268.1 site-specific recombinase XerD [Marinicella litoralis]